MLDALRHCLVTGDALRPAAWGPGFYLRVPDECWSAGTVIACAADLLILGRDANLGPTDSIAHVDPSEIRTGPTTTAAMQGLDVGPRARPHRFLIYFPSAGIDSR